MGKKARVKPGSKRAAYNKIHRTEGEQIRAMEMLLGVKWAGGCFVQRSVAGGLPTHCYYDRHGNVISFAQAMVLTGNRPPPQTKGP